MSTDRSMDKEVVVHIYNYPTIKINKLKSVLMKWMNLEPIILSEVKLGRERQISYINTYMWHLEG